MAMQTEIPQEFDILSMIDTLSGGDITKHESVFKLNYIHCLNLLSLWAYRDKFYETQRLAQQNYR